jgi:hypothetical protein
MYICMCMCMCVCEFLAIIRGGQTPFLEFCGGAFCDVDGGQK